MSLIINIGRMLKPYSVISTGQRSFSLVFSLSGLFLEGSFSIISLVTVIKFSPKNSARKNEL